MMVSTTTERFAFFFAVILTTVWTCQATARTTSTTLGSNGAFLVHRQQHVALAKVSRTGLPEMRSELSSSSSESLAALLVRLRGGEISIPDDDDSDTSPIAAKLRNAIRSILQISDDKLPLVSSFLRTCLKTIETMTGLNLLPPPEEKSSSKKKSSKSAKNKSKNKSKKKSSDSESDIDKPATKKKSSAPKKKVATAATKKHLSTNIKSSNPNYRIQKELKAFLKSPPDNLSVQVGSNIRLWVVTIVGAKDTIYEGEIFKLRIEFPSAYPTVPPSVYFLKKFLPVHEHVYTNGDICLSLLGNGWRPTMSAQSIAVSILSILSSAQSKNLPMDNANHAGAKPGQYQKDWVYHDDSC
jgi:ubiquitin-conjugating enzyme E2 W